MFDALLKSKFYSKCKSEIKLTNKRIEIIMRKRKAMQKFLKNDIADLLRNRLDSNAYGRVEGLYLEQNLSSCYEFVEQSCLLILSHLSAMNKQRECPEECKEAIPSLIFAAARFADLPELREVRSLFAERYGNYLEPYVNQEFIKKLKADPPTKEMKLQMMQEVALESGIQWDSKALEQSLYKPPPFLQDWSQYANETNHESLKTHHQNGFETRIQETEEKHTNKHTEVTKKGHNGLPYKSRAEIEKKKEKKHGHGSVSSNWSSNTSSSSETTSPEYSTGPDDSASEDIPEERKFYALRSMAPPYIKTDSNKMGTVSDISSGFGREEEVFGSKYKDGSLQIGSEDIQEGRKLNGFRSMTPPPYIKTDSCKKATISDTSSGFGREEEVFGSKCKDGSLQNGSEDTQEGRKLYGFRSVAPPPYIKTDSCKKATTSDVTSGFGREKEVFGSKCKDGNLQSDSEDIQEGRKLSGFRSMAPPYIKTDLTKKATISDTSSVSSKEKVAGSKVEESVNITKPVPRSMRIRRALKPVNNEVSEQSPKISNGENCDNRDEGEKKMDKLLSHYSRKASKSSAAESSMANNGCREARAPIRAGSLPSEPFGAPDEWKGIARAATFQPDSGPSPRSHVHPKLPDYDDFVARLAAFRASS
ncbi:hypothetical protein L6452_07665 [Arctium lappa]|uniref:Uncharacterized protein n=1 Tax=Arctium lappa TaxID=4217 RepID=A0ACB9EL73_ARCLA|nr:hypothetical protein L6452_07665 [Arctium lappa]